MSTTASRLAKVEASRQLLLEQLSDAPDLTVVCGVGNCGDELIWAGTRQLLTGKSYQEIGLDELCAANGHTVLLNGSGAFCRPYHEIMQRALAVAGLRFERVIILPSSFDPSEDVVREALARTRATVFAREPESYKRIASLCDAQLAHDCAFFFDFEPYRSATAASSTPLGPIEKESPDRRFRTTTTTSPSVRRAWSSGSRRSPLTSTSEPTGRT